MQLKFCPSQRSFGTKAAAVRQSCACGDEQQASFSGRRTTSESARTPLGRSPSSHRRELAQATQGSDNHRLTHSVWGAAVVSGLLLHAALGVAPADALALHEEPANALSLPTWAIHVSSVVEWVTAMGLMWQFAEVSGNQRWKGMTWAMLPCLGSAMAACTWHFMYNAPELEFLVVLQSALTVGARVACRRECSPIAAGRQSACAHAPGLSSSGQVSSLPCLQMGG